MLQERRPRSPIVSNQQEAELEVLIRARYPLIYFVTWEEHRAEAMLARIAQRRNKKLFSWSVTQGMCERGKTPDNTARDPQAALDFIAKSNHEALFILKDFHAFMQDAGVIRRLRDIVQVLKPSYKSLLIMSPTLVIPTELEKDVTVVDYDLPGAQELSTLFDDAVNASMNGSKFKVELGPGDRERIVQSAVGMTLSEAENAFAKSIVTNGKLGLEAIDVILQEIKQVIRKSRQLEYYEANERFGNIGGLEVLKDWLMKRGRAFSEDARKFGLPQPKGILLLGVQGCGKSLTCKAVAGLWKLPLLRMDMGAIFGGFVGQSEENMRRAIKTAESVAPCVLWLDEIEKGLAGTQSSNFSDGGTTARVFSTFLTWLQEKKKSVFVAATANNIKLLPPELLRKGRLDEIFFVDLPSAQERALIFDIHIRAKKRDPSKFDVAELARLSDGFSGSEIEQAVTASLYDAFNKGRDIANADLADAVKAMIPLSRTMKEEIEDLRAWASTRARPASVVGGNGVAPAMRAGGFDRKVELT
ncbi:MAG: AAA family ATPase [Elusimicrobia bacterium]|nr:AAA family ATPase [Elusimicrobiota bacterium]